jgi:hypothetical protein
MEAEWSGSRSSRFIPGLNPGTHGIGNWLSPRAGLGVFETRKSLDPTGIRTPDRPAISLVAMPTMLSPYTLEGSRADGRIIIQWTLIV